MLRVNQLVGFGNVEPTPIYTTWNPSDVHASLTLSNGNLTITKNAENVEDRAVRCIGGKSAGKFYAEMLNGSTPFITNGGQFGVMKSTDALTNDVGIQTNGYGDMADRATTRHNGSDTAQGAAWDITGDVVQVAIDFDAGKIWWGVDDVWIGDPGAGTGEAYSGLSGEYFLAASCRIIGVTADAQFAPSSWTYAAPSGFGGWTV